ncbi:hypothetical protein V6Z11_D08G277400 [Gossypium hirsutum]|uniref:Uncharacterized protein isoform X2 n=1 Tax=Gossypium hirsutum TaxID=3635 RepID=A0A1U8LK60_GOSHI|nr:uncharacterized protein LOC107928288 isoform X2 [Gossypium hirsutum]
MSNNFFAIVYYDGKISKSDTDVVFESDDPISLTFIKDITLEEMKCKINRKIGAGNTKTISSLNTKTISSLTYRFPLSLIRGAFVYGAVVIDDDDDVTTMIAAHEKSGNVALELYVELEDVEKGCRDVNVPASNPEIQPIRQFEAEIPSSSRVATEAAVDLNIVPFGESYVFKEYENEDEDEEDRDSDVEIIPAPGPHLSLSIGSSRDLPAYQPPSHMYDLFRDW